MCDLVCDRYPVLAVWDATSGKAVSETAPGLLDIGRTMLQTTYVDIGNR